MASENYSPPSLCAFKRHRYSIKFVSRKRTTQTEPPNSIEIRNRNMALFEMPERRTKNPAQVVSRNTQDCQYNKFLY